MRPSATEDDETSDELAEARTTRMRAMTITLITGANGLGKTSFFDGVEWALTNQVSRFQDIPVDGRRKEPDPLTRIGAPENSHRVSLQFSDGEPIDRGAGFVPATAG